MTSLRTLIASAALAAAIAIPATLSGARQLPVVTKDGQRYYEYMVRRGETIFSITRQFGVDKAIFLDCNPDVAAEGLKADRPVYFPVESVSEKKVTPLPVQTITTHGQTHLVQKGETLYGISKKYNTTVEQLVKENPHAAEGIKSGQVLILPVSDTGAPAPYTDISDDTTDNISTPDGYTGTYQDDEDDESYSDEPMPHLTREYSVAVMLPLMLNAPENDEKAAKTSDMYTGFIKGLLMAADTLRHTGEKVTVRIFDTEASDARVTSLLNDSDIRQADVIIAPDAASQIAILAGADDSEGPDVFNIFNVQDNTYATNPRIIQGNIDHHTMYDKAIDALMARFNGYTPVILVAEGGRSEKIEFINAVKKRYHDSPSAPQIKEIRFNGNLKEEDLSPLMVTSDSRKYVFLPVSGTLSEFNRIQNAIIQLKEKSSDPSDIMIFGYPDWIAFRIDRLEKLHKLDATIYSRFYDNPEDPETKAFSDAFRNNFGTEIRDVVPKQEILGYDTGMYIIQALRQGEGDITSGPMRFTGLQSSFFFDASEESQGTANKALYIINYRPDGSVAKEVL